MSDRYNQPAEGEHVDEWGSLLNQNFNDIGADVDSLVDQVDSLDPNSGTGDTGQSYQFDVPTDYATVSEAFDAIDPMYTTVGRTITINIESGHELQDFVSKGRSNYRNVVVESEDDVVYVSSNFPDRHVFQFQDYCIAPTFRILVDGQGHGYTGFNILFGSEIHFDDADGTVGARNCDVGLACNQRSRAYGDNLDFSGASYRGAMVNNNSVAMLHNADFSGAAVYGLRCSMSRVDCIQSDMTNCGDNGLRANQNAIVQARACDVSNSDNIGLSATMNAYVAAESITAQNCTSHGIMVDASTLFIRDHTVGSNGGWNIAEENNPTIRGSP